MNKNNLWLDCEPYAIFPKIFFTDGRYRKLSANAKVLYVFLYDRVKLSARFDVSDDEKELYVFCSLASASEILDCSNRTAINTFRELEDRGLLTRISQGKGRAYKLYLHKPDFN